MPMVWMVSEMEEGCVPGTGEVQAVVGRPNFRGQKAHIMVLLNATVIMTGWSLPVNKSVGVLQLSGGAVPELIRIHAETR